MKSKQKHQYQTLFDGKDIRVKYFGGGASRALVTFTKWAAKPPAKPVFPSLAKAGGMSFIGFQSLRNHRWQTEELPEACARVQELLGADCDVTTFGMSMGATGAVLAAQFLPTNRVVAVAPRPVPPPDLKAVDQPEDDDQVYRNVLRHPREAQARMIIPLRPWARPDTDCSILFDPFHDIDRPFVSLIRERCGEIDRWPLAFSGHMVLSRLKTAGVMRQFTTEMLINGDKHAARQIYRDARHRLGLHLYHLGMRQIGQQKGRFPSAVVGLSEYLTERYGPNVQWVERMAEANASMKKYDKAAAAYDLCYRVSGRKKFSRLSHKLQIMASRRA